MALYVVLSAAGEVYAASYFQQADVFVALLLSFAVVCLMFNLLARHGGGGATVTKWSLLVFVALNVVTAISWIGLFIGLKYAEPAIVVAFMKPEDAEHVVDTVVERLQSQSAEIEACVKALDEPRRRGLLTPIQVPEVQKKIVRLKAMLSEVKGQARTATAQKASIEIDCMN